MLFDSRTREPLGQADIMKGVSRENVYENTRAVHKASVPLIVGSDSSGPRRGTQYGLGVHMEIYNLKHEIG